LLLNLLQGLPSTVVPGIEGDGLLELPFRLLEVAPLLFVEPRPIVFASGLPNLEAPRGRVRGE
jgi:hypothetical protein